MNPEAPRDERLLSAEQIKAIRDGSRGLGEYRPDRDREFLDVLIWRGEQIDRLLADRDALAAEHARLVAEGQGARLLTDHELADVLAQVVVALAHRFPDDHEAAAQILAPLMNHLIALAAEHARLVAAIQGALGVLDAMVTPQSGTAILVSIETIAQVIGDELRAALATRL